MKKLEVNKVYIGDCLDVLTTFPDESIDMCITSPPYWNILNQKRSRFNFETGSIVFNVLEYLAVHEVR